MATRLSYWSYLLTGVVLVACGSAAYAQARSTDATQPAAPKVTTAPCDPIQSIEGKENFRAYCAVCHGTDAKGNGPAALAMKTPVPDLTTMAKRHGGTFDFAAAEYIIRGTGKMATPAHGTSEMPVWGTAFAPPLANPATSSLRIKNLVRYIETLQQ